MPGIKENTTYKKMDEIFPSVVKAAYNLGESLPKSSSKAVDVSKFNNLAEKVSTYQPSTQSPQEGQNLGSGVVTTPYGGSTRFESFHPGIDIASKIGTPIKAFTPGVVQEVVQGKKQGDPGFGNYVLVRDPEGNLQRYSHLYGTFVKVGESIGKGQEIGTEGNSGQTYSISGGTGSHLDFRVKDVFGKYINPNKFIKNQ